MVTTTESQISYAYSGNVATQYAFSFPLAAEGDLVVQKFDTVTLGTTAIEDFSATFYRDTHNRILGGHLVLGSTPTMGENEVLRLRRETSLTQLVDLVEAGRLSAEAIEGALDRVMMAAQEAVRDSRENAVYLDDDVTIAAAGNGLIVQAGSGVFVSRSLTGDANLSGIGIGNAAGVAGNPVIQFDPARMTAFAAEFGAGNVIDAEDEPGWLVPIGNGTKNLKVPLDTLRNQLFGRVSGVRYGYHYIPGDVMQVRGSTGASKSTGTYSGGMAPHPRIAFSTTAGTAYARFFIPHDWIESTLAICVHFGAESTLSDDIVLGLGARIGVSDAQKLDDDSLATSNFTLSPSPCNPSGWLEIPVENDDPDSADIAPGASVLIKIVRNYSGNAEDTANQTIFVHGLGVRYGISALS